MRTCGGLSVNDLEPIIKIYLNFVRAVASNR